MLTLAEFELAAPASYRLTTASGSLLHGALLERLDPALAAALHQPGLRPYSQHLALSGERVVWRVATLTAETAEAIAAPLLADGFDSLYLRNKQVKVAVVAKRQVFTFSYKKFVDSFFLAPLPARRVVLKFTTPASFKVDGNYVIFPSVFHIYQSIFNRWNAFASEFSLGSAQALEELAAHTRVAGYRLHMAYFSLEGVRIPALRGEMELDIAGPEALARLGVMLLAYGEFAGVGIKTALGMGGVTAWAKPRGAASLVSLQPFSP